MENNRMSRKDFLKITGTITVGTAMGLAGGHKELDAAMANAGNLPSIPRRKLGKTGVMVSVISNGVMYNVVDKQILLKKTLDWGIAHWDTSHGYAQGNSEIGMGIYLKKHPEKRKDIFLVSKASGARTPDQVEDCLQTSLKRLNTSYIDLFYGVHGCSSPDQLSPELRKWAEGAKKRKLIKYFGFSTHKNMPNCLMAASKLDWIDAVMTSYNFRLMQEPDMQKAVDACAKANIGLIAMKVMGLSISSDGDKKLTDHFVKKGFSEGQAKLKAVLADTRIAAACITMENTALIATNAEAALDKVKLTRADMKVFREYALSTCSGYCAGCADLCDAAMPEAPVVSDIMRGLMYYNSYGNEEMARNLYSGISPEIRNNLLALDYAKAESACPRNIPIGALIREAVEKLS
ncbi:MAG: aldo/keto reductase [Spirochaetae bacterium HGW-Spirochaetae-1]|nr:MAG: aldo/keto reductase [Spirochaetae bacterium HGW-Spirochaetae-1]